MKVFKNKYIIFALCLILSGVIAFVIVPSSNRSADGTVEVVRVAKQIGKNTVITVDMLEVKTAAPIGLTEDVIKDKQAVIGKIAAVMLFPEDNLIPQKFTDIHSITNKELYDADNPESLAVSVSVKSLAASLSGKLMPGDVVSIYGFNTEQKTMFGHDNLMFVEVLAVTNSKAEDMDQRTADGETDTSDTVIPAAITLSVNRNQAKELENKGNIHAVFVGRGETSHSLLTK